MAIEVDLKRTLPVVHDRVPAPRRVAVDAPWNWLAAGWRDICRAPHVSLNFGLAFALVTSGLGSLLARFQALSLFLPLVGGCLLIGPLLAVGLYESSRRLQQGHDVRLADVAWAWRDARGQLGFFGIALMFVFLVWMQAAFLLLMLFLGSSAPPPPSTFVQELIFTPRGLGLLVVGTIFGGLMAVLVFATSAFAVPILLISQVDAYSAARASVMAVRLNIRPMALWGCLIVAIMVAGVVPLLAGLIVAFPLLGHASWHAYSDVFDDAGQS